MKPELVCTTCGCALKRERGEPYLTSDGRPHCAVCGAKIKAETEAREAMLAARAQSEAPPIPERSAFSSDIEYDIALARAKGASDLHLKSGSPPVIRVAGMLEVLPGPPLEDQRLLGFLKSETSVDTERLLGGNQAFDFAVTLAGVRLRGNAYKDRRGVGIALRLLTLAVQDFAHLGIPEVLKTFAMRRSGLVLITGPTGSGKTTTLTCLIDYINGLRHSHIIMLEDPIEFIHTNKNCIITQREIGRDTPSFGDAITEAMREDPDIIMVGEMRDRASIEAALRAAETGHLVFSTLHTKGAVNSVSRIVDVFPPEQQEQIRTQLSMSLLAVVSQQLLPGINRGERHLAAEVLLVNDPVRSMIKQNKLHMVASTIQTSKKEGMHTMKSSLERLLYAGKITNEIFDAYQI